MKFLVLLFTLATFFASPAFATNECDPAWDICIQVTVVGNDARVTGLSFKDVKTKNLDLPVDFKLNDDGDKPNTELLVDPGTGLTTLRTDDGQVLFSLGNIGGPITDEERKAYVFHREFSLSPGNTISREVKTKWKIFCRTAFIKWTDIFRNKIYNFTVTSSSGAKLPLYGEDYIRFTTMPGCWKKSCSKAL